MGTIEGFLYGLDLALSPELLLAAFVGALAGTLIGILPGLGPVAGAALLLPLTFAYEPVVGMIMIAGIYIGTQFAGSMTSILLNMPGDAQSVVATFDGHPMMKNGRGGAALTIMTLGSFISGLIGLAIVLLVLPAVTGVAMRFGPAEFFALTAGGLLVLARISGGSLGSGLLPMIIGVALATIGLDVNTSTNRFTFGQIDLTLGVALASVAVGLYGLSELMFMLTGDSKRPKPRRLRLRELIPTKEELGRSITPWGRGSLIGFGFGLIPGPAAALSTFASYKVEQTVSKHRKDLGTGAVEGVAGPEAANSSATIGSIVPVLMLGIPFSATLALMISAMTVQGVQPGPLLATQRPDLFWSVIASILVANVMLLLLNLPLIGVWIKLIMTPMRYMVPFIIIIASIGAYSINSNFIDLHIVLIAGIFGYFLRLLDFSPASLLVGLVLGSMIERYFVQGMVTYRGDIWAMVGASGISITIWALVVIVLFAGLLKPVWTGLKRRVRKPVA
ncbi:MULTISPECIES: tripartite tricarboxylate transporter permease [unclassified Nocardiopsis]|jgi:putative tricarboxylic transport membrane protein|uniref:tripartite tricarboxylate transporter permease n=1 Tax=unclassified Nocardiopsis TaxID=2649073 RepID=UPI00066A475D|nr:MULTISPECIES: tripartite tricarboxylate transporter permease [unclassified Nocardiopsis]MBQ1080160.1 tripartite tricarboxylate transporter permease [Nocardiopsis sp. B62]